MPFRTRKRIKTRGERKRKNMNPRIQIKTVIALFLIVSACVALSPALRAVSPPPDGGYPNQNTAEGADALFNLTTGSVNTAVGFQALFNLTQGIGNTAVGSLALSGQSEGIFNTAIGLQAIMNSGRIGRA